MTTGTADTTVRGQGDARDARDRADQLLAAGRADEAAEILRTLTRQHPEDPWAWQRLAAALLAVNGGEAYDAQARDAAERGVTLDPSSAIGYRMLSEAALRLGDEDAALATMRAAVQAAPDSWVAHLDLAAAVVKQPGGGREAWRIARRAAKLAPDRPEPHLMLGDLALRAGDVGYAAAGYSDALDRDPGNALATRKLAELHGQLDDTPPDTGPRTGADHQAARLIGNGLASLSVLTALVTGMLMVLAPDEVTGWFSGIGLVASGGLLLVALALITGSRKLVDHLPGGARYRSGLLVSALGLGAAIIALELGCLLTVGALRVALCLALAGYAAGHMTARFADRAGSPIADDRQAERMRSGAFFGLALGNLLHAVGYIVLALLSAVLPAGAFQLLAVLVVVALIFVTGVQDAALAGLSAVHRRRFGWVPRSVLATVAGSALVDLIGASGALAGLFVPVPTLVLLAATFLCFLLATGSALAAANLRS